MTRRRAAAGAGERPDQTARGASAGAKTEAAHVLYVSSFLSGEAYDRLLASAPYPPSQATQKYNALLGAGLVSCGARVTALSAPPLSRRTGGKLIAQLPHERADGVDFYYLPVLNVPVLKQLITWLAAFFSTLRLCKRDTLVLCYGLIVSACGGARAAVRLMGRPACVIVSDVPEELGAGLQMRMAARALARYDGYVLLASAMNERVNPNGKPFCVMEGQVDATLAAYPPPKRPPDAVKTCLYAGMLHARYGVLRLVSAFSLLDDPDARLVLYGTGDAKEEIERAAARDVRIQYRGVADNATVVAEEARATLLINPRPTDEAFVRYSFPSKNLEYMVTGVPVLTTRLPGMPEEYFAHVFLFDEETSEAMARTLAAVLALPQDALEQKGLAARAFVLQHKSNTVQAGRLLAFIKTLG